MRGQAAPIDPFPGGDLVEETVGRLIESIAMLDAIEKGDLFAQLPPGAESAARHQCGVSLLAVLRRELTALVEELDSVSQVRSLMNRLAKPGPVE